MKRPKELHLAEVGFDSKLDAYMFFKDEYEMDDESAVELVQVMYNEKPTSELNKWILVKSEGRRSRKKV